MALLIQLKENVALFLLCFMSLQAGSVMRLPKFEVDIPAASKAQKVQLLERDVTLANMWVITVQPKIHTSQSSLNSKIDLVTNHVCRNSDFWFHQFDFYGIILLCACDRDSDSNVSDYFYTKEWRASNFPYIITPESSISGCKNKGNDQQVKELY